MMLAPMIAHFRFVSIGRSPILAPSGRPPVTLPQQLPQWYLMVVVPLRLSRAISCSQQRAGSPLRPRVSRVLAESSACIQTLRLACPRGCRGGGRGGGMRVQVVEHMIVVYHVHQWRRLLVVEGPRGRVEALATHVDDPARE